MKMNNAFSLLRTLQMGGLLFGVPRTYDRDCSPSKSPSDLSRVTPGRFLSPLDVQQAKDFTNATKNEMVRCS